jgi:hypothetical protein
MGSQPAPVHQDRQTTARSGAPDVPHETERLDPTDTRVMATRHLAPFVSEEEEGEYQRLAHSSFFYFEYALLTQTPPRVA